MRLSSRSGMGNHSVAAVGRVAPAVPMWPDPTTPPMPVPPIMSPPILPPSPTRRTRRGGAHDIAPVEEDERLHLRHHGLVEDHPQGAHRGRVRSASGGKD